MADPQRIDVDVLTLIVDRIAAESDTPSATAIAAAISRMITAGELAPEAQLPTVRQLSRELKVSPSTVSEAWRGLAAAGAIETRGRNGTFVHAWSGTGGPRRYRRISERGGRFTVDLSAGTPDPDLLPDLGPAVARIGRRSLTSSYLDAPVLPELAELLHADWPFAAESITVVDGALDALDRVAQIVLRLGDRVVVEHPCFPPVLDLLEQIGCDVIGVDVDDRGMVPAGLTAALVHRPRAVMLQPRAQNPTGVAIDTERAAELARIIGDSPIVVVEDDHANDISEAPLVSLGTWLPERTVHIRSYSKSHGPDLRLAAVGGMASVVDALVDRRTLGPGWSSRILQAVLVELLRDPGTADRIAEARRVYRRRRDAVAGRLREAEVDHTAGDGINLWMRVADERSALVQLASHGIGVAPGTPFLTRPDTDHLRITISKIPDDELDRVAGLLVDAAGDTRIRTALR